jgi:hypothetical protein
VLVITRQRTLLRTARGLGRAVLAALVAAILVLGVLRAGSRYFYCESTGTVLTMPCCEESHEASAGGEVRNEDCCRSRSVGSLPVVAIQTPPAMPLAPFVAMLQHPAAGRLTASAWRDAPRANFTGPPLLSPSDHRARLMVFLI